MRTIAFLTQKGGTGKTTLAASIAVAAVEKGEKVVVLDFDPQGSLMHWGERRQAANARCQLKCQVIVEPFESDRLPRLPSILAGLEGVGFTLAIFDTAGADASATRLVAEAADLCLLPARPSRLDVEATAATFRCAFLAKRKAAFVLNQCPPTLRSARITDSAKGLSHLGVLAEPMLTARMDFQDAMNAGLGATEYARGSRAAQEIETLWAWIGRQLAVGESEAPPHKVARQAA
jgi:chromosome partitioning protein